MAVVEEEVFGEIFQFVVDLHQMHQDLLLERRPARTPMGAQELLGNAMASPKDLRIPLGNRGVIDMPMAVTTGDDYRNSVIAILLLRWPRELWLSV